MAQESEWLKAVIQNTTPTQERLLEMTTSAPILGAIKELQAKGSLSPQDAKETDEERKHLLACVKLAMDQGASRREARIAASAAVSVAFIIGLYCGARLPETVTEIAKEMRSLGGRKSGEARRQKAQITWKPHALDLAQAYCRKQQTRPPAERRLSQDDIVAEIIGSWKLAGVECPGHSSLKDFIAQQQKSGTLPRAIRQRTSSRG